MTKKTSTPTKPPAHPGEAGVEQHDDEHGQARAGLRCRGEIRRGCWTWRVWARICHSSYRSAVEFRRPRWRRAGEFRVTDAELPQTIGRSSSPRNGQRWPGRIDVRGPSGSTFVGPTRLGASPIRDRRYTAEPGRTTLGERLVQRPDPRTARTTDASRDPTDPVDRRAGRGRVVAICDPLGLLACARERPGLRRGPGPNVASADPVAANPLPSSGPPSPAPDASPAPIRPRSRRCRRT